MSDTLSNGWRYPLRPPKEPAPARGECWGRYSSETTAGMASGSASIS